MSLVCVTAFLYGYSQEENLDDGSDGKQTVSQVEESKMDPKRWTNVSGPDMKKIIRIQAYFRGQDGHVSSLHCWFYRCNWGESTWIFMFCLLNQNTNHRNQSTCSKLGSLDNINNHQAIELLWV